MMVMVPPGLGFWKSQVVAVDTCVREPITMRLTRTIPLSRLSSVGKRGYVGERRLRVS